jgi:hypothetical protein
MHIFIEMIWWYVLDSRCVRCAAGRICHPSVYLPKQNETKAEYIERIPVMNTQRKGSNVLRKKRRKKKQQKTTAN